MCSTFSKANVIRNLAYKVKYIRQINRGLMVLIGKSRIGFFKICCLDCEQNEKKNQFKKKNIIKSSAFKVLR